MPRPDPETAQRRANAFLSTGAEYHRVRPGYPDDVVAEPLLPVDGALPVRRPVLDLEAVRRLAAPPERAAHWAARLAEVRRVAGAGRAEGSGT